jgi:hypothetical protein
LAGIVNLAGNFARSINAELTAVYNNRTVTTDFQDTTKSFCGYYMQDAELESIRLGSDTGQRSEDESRAGGIGRFHLMGIWG